MLSSTVKLARVIGFDSDVSVDNSKHPRASQVHFGLIVTRNSIKFLELV